MICKTNTSVCVCGKDNPCKVSKNLCKTCGTICPFDDERTECDAYAPLTNENWFISLSTEEKAKWLSEHLHCGDCDIENRTCAGTYDGCKETLIRWLKQPHKE